jgi:hypothetical protein
MLEYLVDLPLFGAPVLVKEVEFWPEGWLRDGARICTIHENKLYTSLSDKRHQELLAVYPDIENVEYYIALPVPIVAVAAAYVSYHDFEIALALGNDRVIYDLFGEIMTPESIESWFGDEEHDLLSQFYTSSD